MANHDNPPVPEGQVPTPKPNAADGDTPTSAPSSERPGDRFKRYAEERRMHRTSKESAEDAVEKLAVLKGGKAAQNASTIRSRRLHWPIGNSSLVILGSLAVVMIIALATLAYCGSRKCEYPWCKYMTCTTSETSDIEALPKGPPYSGVVTPESTASAPVQAIPPVQIASAPLSSNGPKAKTAEHPSKKEKIAKEAREARESAARLAKAARAEKARAERLEREKAAQAKTEAVASPPKQTQVLASLPPQATPGSGEASATGKPFRWTKVGGDPCNPKAGCTLEWALGKTGWPDDVQLGLIAAVKGSSPETITITSGLGGSKGPAWTGWMTWGKYAPKFEMHTIAAWPSGKHEPASLWTYVSGSTKYNLIKVKKCGNWGGWTEFISTPPMSPVGVVRPLPQMKPASPDVMPLGVIPVVACVEEE